MAGAQTLPSQKLSIRVQTGGAGLIQELAEEWRRLCDETPEGEPFYRPEWAQAFLAAFAPSAKLIVISARSDQGLRGVLPLIEERSFLSGLPVKRIAGPANVHCSRLGLAYCAGGEGEEVLQALWESVKALPGWHLLDFNYVLGGNGIDQLARLAAADSFRVARKPTWQALYLPVATSAKGEPTWLEGTRPKFRSNLRRSRRQLEELGAVTTRHYDSADREALQQFYDLESSGWKGKQRTAIACDPRTRRFYDEVAQTAAGDGHLSLDFLDLNAKPIAAHFALVFQGRYCLAKAGYDESYQRFGPGQLLVREVLSQSGPRGLRELDFVGPATWDETRWASARRDHFHIFIFRKGWYGWLLHVVRVAARRLAKRLLRRGEDKHPVVESDSQPQNGDKGSKHGS